MFIKQISVFLENTPGSLREMTELLGRGGVDLLALSLADTQNFGIVRLIVHSEQIDPAVALLKQNGYIAKVNHVICAAVPDRPLGLCELLLARQFTVSLTYFRDKDWITKELRKVGDAAVLCEELAPCRCHRTEKEG
ncbi:MAG: hypothetical protein IKN65_02255, partial [Clostridia bacterium]|nr:hypothetical protein [Clostridia bacterium]